MRDELHLMELVDRYLDDAMTDPDRAAFEARAKGNTELQQLIDDQRAIREGVARIALRQLVIKSSPSGGKGWIRPAMGGVAFAMVATYAWMNWGRTPRHEVPHPETEQLDTIDVPEARSSTPERDAELRIVRDTIVHTDTHVVVKRLLIPPGTSRERQRALMDSVRASVVDPTTSTNEVGAQTSGLILQNVLTPDGDGVNDRLIIPGGPYRHATMSVFSAAGELVFKSSAQDPSWNGLLSNGRRAEAGMYKVEATAVGRSGGTLVGREQVRLQWSDISQGAPMAY